MTARTGRDATPAEIARVLSDPGVRVVVTAHHNPDGDAIGSVLGLARALRAAGRDVVIAHPDVPAVPSDLAFLPAPGEEFSPELPADVGERVLVAVDCATERRMWPEPVHEAARLVINIDHHQDNTRFGDLNLIEPDASSTAEVLVGVLDAAGLPLTRDVAEALYVGLVTDTGRFGYTNTRPRAHEIAARMIAAGVDPAAAFAGTFHVNEGYGQLEAAYAAARSGRLPDPVPCEVYCHTLSDRSILGPALADSPAQTLTLFGLHLPARLFLDDPDGTRAAALDATLRSLDSVLGEPIRDVLAVDADGRPCLEVTTPLDLEQSLGLPGGNIFHRSLQWPWAETPAEVGTWGVETPHSNLALASAGARRGGGVSGIPGHNAARAVLQRAG